MRYELLAELPYGHVRASVYVTADSEREAREKARQCVASSISFPGILERPDLATWDGQRAQVQPRAGDYQINR